jgi:hypothetical protein
MVAGLEAKTSSPQGDCEMTSLGELYESSLAEIRLRPVNPVAENRLLTRRQQCSPILWAERQLVSEDLDYSANAYFSPRGLPKDGEHEELVIRNCHDSDTREY